MQSKTVKRTSGAVRGCGHCRNLQRSDWTGHIAKECPQLAVTKCSYCKKLGHTTNYCFTRQDELAMKIINTPEMQESIDKAFQNMTIIGGASLAQASAPVGNSWANLVKKSLTPEEKAAVEEENRKVKEQELLKIEERKKKEREAYLERKERREERAKQKKAQEDANYKLYVQHMWYENGPNWYHNFESGSSREKEIPDPFYHRVQQEIAEDYKVHYEMEAEADKEWREKEAAKGAEKAKMKSTLSPEKYQEWKEEKYWKFNEEVDDYLDRGFCEISEEGWITRQREKNGKIWLEEKMKDGEIVLGADGKYKYFGKV